jgi:hypothetical protein
VQKRCIEYKQTKLFKKNGKKFIDIFNKINEQLKKEHEKPVPRHMYFNFVYFVYLSSCTDIKDTDLKHYLNNYIYNQDYYKNKSCSYCRFLELEYKYRNELLKLMEV